MIKTANVEVDVEIEAEDVQYFLEDDFYSLSNYDRKILIKIMKELVLESGLNADDILYYLRSNPTIAHEIKEYLNQNEMV